ncbi:hypothetical protein [Clostridium sp.]|uniref:hypothetical protein n=1 Tax=Clostridium sp. TaxID=1506 RepID=UPI0026370E0D|nr:hypothetical protein [Clostridium sp.]
MEENYRSLLSTILSDRLLANWNECNSLSSSSERYNEVTDECCKIHALTRELKIPLPEYVLARF